MDYKQKYLKYKMKYLELKQQGGNYSIEKYDSIYKYDADIETLNHIVTPMNAYNIVDINDNNILTTTGVVDCVVLLIYNKNHGRYIGHFLKFNEFENSLSGIASNACESNRHPECTIPSTDRGFQTLECNNDDFMSSNKSIQKTFMKDSKKIYNSLPSWINDCNTHIHIINSTDLFKVYSRYTQIFSKFPNAKIKIYLKELVNDDIQFFKQNLKYTSAHITYIQEQTNAQVPLTAYEIIGIKPNGEIFGIMKDQLKEDEKYHKFYRSIFINRLSSPNINKRCIMQYAIDMNIYEEYKSDIMKLEQLINQQKVEDIMYTEYQRNLYEFLENPKMYIEILKERIKSNPEKYKQILKGIIRENSEKYTELIEEIKRDNPEIYTKILEEIKS